MTNGILPKSILITQGELVQYAGSEIITLELAEYFSQKGSRVDILSGHIGLPIKKEFTRLKNVSLHTTTQKINFNNLDLVWIHHNLIPSEIIKLATSGSLKSRVVFHHMSSVLPLEAPFYPIIEKELADLILFNSYLTKNAIESKTKDISLSGEVFNNPAPEKFYKARPELNKEKPRKILVVSSHAPKEIITATNMLKRRNISIEFMGEGRLREFRCVTPKDIINADVVITIGKTVQYCVLSGTPVYCYDHFGGPGYLSRRNFLKAAEYGFSGKGFSMKTPTVITQDILGQYRRSQIDAKYIKNMHSADYLMPARIDMVLKNIQREKINNKLNVDKIHLEAFYDTNEEFWNYHSAYNKTSMLKQELEQELNNLKNSFSWNITEPLRKIRRLFH